MSDRHDRAPVLRKNRIFLYSLRYADRLSSMPRWLSATKRPRFSVLSHDMGRRVYSFCIVDSHDQASRTITSAGGETAGG